MGQTEGVALAGRHPFDHPEKIFKRKAQGPCHILIQELISQPLQAAIDRPAAPSSISKTHDPFSFQSHLQRNLVSAYGVGQPMFLGDYLRLIITPLGELFELSKEPQGLSVATP